MNAAPSVCVSLSSSSPLVVSLPLACAAAGVCELHPRVLCVSVLKNSQLFPERILAPHEETSQDGDAGKILHSTP